MKTDADGSIFETNDITGKMMQKVHIDGWDGQNVWIDFRNENTPGAYPAVISSAGDRRIQRGEFYRITEKEMQKITRGNYHILQYTQEGCGKIIYRNDGEEEQAYELTPGQCFFISAGQRFEFFTPEHSSWSYIYVGFRGEFAERLFRRIAEGSPVRFLPPGSAAVAGFHEIFHRGLRHEISESDLKILSCTILLELEREFFQQPAETRNVFLSQAEEWCRDNLSNATVQRLAKYFHFSEKYFQKLFKRKTGSSPGQFLTEQRLQCATRLLECTNMKLSGIAELAGFSDASHLCRSFRRQYGMTPDTYRKQRKSTEGIPSDTSMEP